MLEEVPEVEGLPQTFNIPENSVKEHSMQVLELRKIHQERAAALRDHVASIKSLLLGSGCFPAGGFPPSLTGDACQPDEVLDDSSFTL